MPPPALGPVRPTEPDDAPRLDSLVRELVDAYRSQADAQDRRHQELLDSVRTRDEQYAAREAKRDQQHSALVASVNGLTVSVGALADKVPGRRELWAGAPSARVGGAFVRRRLA